MSKKKNIDRCISENVLDMSLLQLTEIPFKNKVIESIPKSVTSMNFSYNLLTSIPPEICSLTQIRELNLIKNQISSLPEAFGNLVNLRKLDLYDNKLTFLPLSFWKLQKLKWLDISSNPLIPDLLSIAGPCQNSNECELAARQTVNFFKMLQNQVQMEYEKMKKAEKEKVEEKQPALKIKKQKNKNLKKSSQQSEDAEITNPEMQVNTESGVKQRSICTRHYVYFYAFAVFIIVIGYLYGKYKSAIATAQ